MIHPTKIGIVVRDDLQTWQKLNVAAFLVSGVAANSDSIGEQYEDASGNRYLSIFGQPVFVYAATNEHLQRTRARAVTREVPMSIYTLDMFKTSDDASNRAEVKAVAAEDLDIAGIAFRADSKIFDKIVSGLKLHP